MVAFADVVIQRGEQQRVRRLGGHVQALADGLRKAHHAAAVVIGVVILPVDLRVQIVEVVDKPHEIIENRLGGEAQKPHVRLGRDGNVVVETGGVKRIADAERLRLAFVGVQRQFARQQRVIFQITGLSGSGVSQTTEPASICGRMTLVSSKLASRRYVLRFWVTVTRESPARETNRWCKPKSLLPDVLMLLKWLNPRTIFFALTLPRSVQRTSSTPHFTWLRQNKKSDALC